MTTIKTRRPHGPADEALIAFEQQIAALRQTQAALQAAGDRSDHDELSKPLFALVTRIAKTAPDSLIGAAVKLRVLADENIGIINDSMGEGDADSIRQILAAVEHSLDAAPPPTPGFYLDRPGALGLENALAEISELSDLLLRMGESGDSDDRPLVYLGHRLQDHHAEAYEAFEKIFGLNAHRSGFRV